MGEVLDKIQIEHKELLTRFNMAVTSIGAIMYAGVLNELECEGITTPNVTRAIGSLSSDKQDMVCEAAQELATRSITQWCLFNRTAPSPELVVKYEECYDEILAGIAAAGE